MSTVPTGAVFMDLCTPPGSPTRDENAARGNSSAAAVDGGSKPSVKAEGKRKAKATECDDDDDECCIVPAPRQPLLGREPAHDSASSSTAASSSAAPEDNDVQFCGRTGDSALIDFPHAREHCVSTPFVPGKHQQHCANCFCFVCDAPAATCPRWFEHCMATHTQQQWQRRREEWRRMPASRAAAPPAAAAPAAASSGQSANPAGGDTWSCDRLLKEVEQVYPKQVGAPEGLHATLRPYQEQSLAFMIDVERSSDPKMIHPTTGVKGGWLCDEMGMGKTCVCAALMLANPSSLKLDMKAARKFAALDFRKSSASRSETIKGTRYTTSGAPNQFKRPDRWMVPTKLVTREVKRNDGSKMTFNEWVEDKSKPPLANPDYTNWEEPPTLRYPITVVLTNVSLLGQWQDEMRKFAPALRVGVYHGSHKEKLFQQLPKLDVVLSTVGQRVWGDHVKYIRFHRLIIDECHQPQAWYSNNITTFNTYDVQHIWGVTGTPLSSSVMDLKHFACLIGQWEDGLRLADKAKSKAELAPLLKKLMIRHVKAQRIGGEVALALPETDTDTVWLDMSSTERRIYTQYKMLSARKIQQIIEEVDERKNRRKTPLIELALAQCRQACAGCYGDIPSFATVDRPLQPSLCAKLQHLLNDLDALRAKEPSLHAVVFTHHTKAYELIRVALQGRNFTVCGFTGATKVDVRHSTIRSFQESADASVAAAAGGGGSGSGAGGSKKAKVEAKVFVATMKVGNVGVTLTAATRVYLFEPCLDPQMELQAAGRIHRLGQTKDVLVKRLVYRDTIEAAILDLHEKIKSGSVAIVDGIWPNDAVKGIHNK